MWARRGDGRRWPVEGVGRRLGGGQWGKAEEMVGDRMGKRMQRKQGGGGGHKKNARVRERDQGPEGSRARHVDEGTGKDTVF